MYTKIEVKEFIEKTFKKLPTNTEVEALYALCNNHYRQGELDSMLKIKDALNIKECQCQ